MRIVIAGGTGFLGTQLAETYAEDGHDVRVLTRDTMADLYAGTLFYKLAGQTPPPA